MVMIGKMTDAFLTALSVLWTGWLRIRIGLTICLAFIGMAVTGEAGAVTQPIWRIIPPLLFTLLCFVLVLIWTRKEEFE